MVSANRDAGGQGASGGSKAREPFTDEGAIEVVREFVRNTIDLPNEAAAKALLTKAGRASDMSFTPPSAGGNLTYKIGQAVKEGDDVLVPVTVTDGSTNQTQTLEIMPVLEDGQWRIDLARTMDRAMGGAMEQLTEQMGDAMKGIGDAMAEGISKAFETISSGGEASEEKEGEDDEDEEDESETSGGGDESTRELNRLIDLAREHMLGWQQNLVEELGTPIGWDVDFDGFASHPDMQKNLFAQHLLREHGIDHIYYAISNLAKRDPAFKDAFARRVGMIRLTHVPTPEEKSLSGDGMTIELKLALHEGYEGYLTPQELEEQLPGIVFAMTEPADGGLFGQVEEREGRAAKPKRTSKPTRAAAPAKKSAKRSPARAAKKAPAKKVTKKKVTKKKMTKKKAGKTAPRPAKKVVKKKAKATKKPARAAKAKRPAARKVMKKTAAKKSKTTKKRRR
jgi:hypothetical protein